MIYREEIKIPIKTILCPSIFSTIHQYPHIQVLSLRFVWNIYKLPTF